MSVSFENTATNRGVVTFTIGQDKIQPALDQAFNKVKKNLNAPGFRKGHMPRAVFNQKFGEEALYDDALNAILPAAYEAAIAELGLDVVAQPKIDVKSIEKGQDWTLTAEVVTKPEVKLGAYKDLEVSVEASKEVTDEEVEAATYCHGSKEMPNRNVVEDLKAAEEMLERRITGLDIIKALSKNGMEDIANNLLNMLKQRVTGDYLQTSAILDKDFNVISAVKVLDYLISDYNEDMYCFGIDGVSYYMDDEGNKE